MAGFLLSFAFLNMIGGRWGALVGEDAKSGGRMIFRCLFPALLTGFLALENDLPLWQVIQATVGVLAGSALWFPYGWSSDEITGRYDPSKYHRWVQRIGVNLVPLVPGRGRNMLRGVIMKGIRGSYDILTFVALIPINPWAPVWWLGTFSMGLVYHATRYLVPERFTVMLAEWLYGAVRAFLIYKAMGL